MRHATKLIKCWPKPFRCPYEMVGGVRCQGWRLPHSGHYHRSDWERRR